MARKAKKAENARGTQSESPKDAAKPLQHKVRRRRAKPKARVAKRTVGRRSKQQTSARRSRRQRVRYTDAQRAKILSAAQRDRLTGAQVRERFGVSTLTYYTWRKKAASPRRARSGRPARQDGAISGQIRDAIRAQVRAMLPQIIEQEVTAVLSKGPKP